MPLENPITLGNLMFSERWDEEEVPYYGYCYDALGDPQKWILIFQDRLRIEKQIIVLTNITWVLEQAETKKA
ncbi:hypothetical protein KKH23_07760 [Patescibacteria group bacterium]|nr:hypothetical protein [Patescibacteria group bacterium]